MKAYFDSAQMLRLSSILLFTLFLCPQLAAKDLAPYSHKHFFSTDHLVRIDLKIKDTHWDTLRFQHRSLVKTLRTDIPPTKQEKQFDYFPATLSIDGVDLGKVAVRKKGFIGSMDDNRPSLKIKLARFDKKKSFADLDTITLNNNKQDPRDINQVIGYQVFRDAGIAAPRCNFSLVTVNGRNMGIYCNIESPDERFARRQFGTNKGALYEGTIADFTEDGLIRFERKFGKKKRDKKLKELSEALTENDDTLMSRLAKTLDLDEFYRYWALECLLGHWDGYVSNKNNYFVYYHPDRERILFVPWGLDQLAEDNNMFWGRGFTAPKSVKADGAVARRLYQTQEGKERYFAALRDLLDTVWDEERLVKQIETLNSLIAPHREHSGQRRRQTGTPLTEFIPARRAQLESEMAGEYPQWTLGVRDMPGHVEKRGDCSVNFSFTMEEIESKEGEFFEIPVEASGSLTIRDEPIPFSKLNMAIRKNRGWGRRPNAGSSYTFQFSQASDDNAPPKTVEITFPVGKSAPAHPIRVDIFASPGNGRLLSGKGKVREDGTLGMMAGLITLNEFGANEGDSIKGSINGEFFQFLN